MEMKSPSCRPTAAADIARVTVERLSLAALLAIVSSKERGGVVTFSGVVRDEEDGRALAALLYDAYEPMAIKELRRLIAAVEARWNVVAAAHHRVGRVPAGEASLLVACAGAHRREAFEAGVELVDRIKMEVPVWKVDFEWR